MKSLEVSEKTKQRVREVYDFLEEHAGGMWYEEACVLYELAAGLHDTRSFDTFNILELGTDAGQSSCIMGYALEDYNLDACVTTVDIAGGNERAAMARQAYRNTNLANRYVCPVNFEDILFFKMICRSLYRMIFIDTSHEEEHTRDEIKHALPHLEPGGWLVFHDYRRGDIEPGFEGALGVELAVDEFLDKTDLTFDVYKDYSLLCLKHDP